VEAADVDEAIRLTASSKASIVEEDEEGTRVDTMSRIMDTIKRMCAREEAHGKDWWVVVVVGGGGGGVVLVVVVV